MFWLIGCSEMRGLGTDIGDSVEAEPLDTIIDEKDQEPATKAVPDEGAPRNLLLPNPQPPPWYFVFFSDASTGQRNRSVASVARLARSTLPWRMPSFARLTIACSNT